MAFRNVPQKTYRLHDGSLGTEYEAVLEALKSLQHKKQDIEDRIEELERRLNGADGHP